MGLRALLSGLVAPVVATACLLTGCVDYMKVESAVKAANAAVIDQEMAAAFLSDGAFDLGGREAAASKLEDGITQLNVAIQAVADNPGAVAPLKLRLALLYLNANLTSSADVTMREIDKSELTSDRDLALLAVWSSLVELQNFRSRRWGEPAASLCPDEYDPEAPETYCAVFAGVRNSLRSRIDILKQSGFEENREIISYLNFNAGMISVESVSNIENFEHQIQYLLPELEAYRSNISCRTVRDHNEVVAGGISLDGDLLDPAFAGPVFRMETVLGRSHDILNAALEQRDVDQGVRNAAVEMLPNTNASGTLDLPRHCLQ